MNCIVILAYFYKINYTRKLHSDSCSFLQKKVIRQNHKVFHLCHYVWVKLGLRSSPHNKSTLVFLIGGGRPDLDQDVLELALLVDLHLVDGLHDDLSSCRPEFQVAQLQQSVKQRILLRQQLATSHPGMAFPFQNKRFP